MASAPIHKKVCMLQNLFSYCVRPQGSRPGRICLVPSRAGPPHGERHELRWTPRLRRRHRRQGRGRRRQRQGERGGHLCRGRAVRRRGAGGVLRVRLLNVRPAPGGEAGRRAPVEESMEKEQCRLHT